MKKPLLLGVLLVVSVQVHAQFRTLGIVVGENLSTYSGVSGAKWTGNFGLGIYADFNLFKGRVSISPRLFLKYNGGAGNITQQPPLSAGGTFDSTGVKRTTNYLTVVLPFNFKITPGINFAVGPQWMMLTQANDVHSSMLAGTTLQVNVAQALHKYDAGITGGVTFKVLKEKQLNVGVWYYYGLMYVVKDNSSQVRNSIVQWWLSIPLWKGKVQ